MCGCSNKKYVFLTNTYVHKHTVYVILENTYVPDNKNVVFCQTRDDPMTRYMCLDNNVLSKNNVL